MLRESRESSEETCAKSRPELVVTWISERTMKKKQSEVV